MIHPRLLTPVPSLVFTVSTWVMSVDLVLRNGSRVGSHQWLEQGYLGTISRHGQFCMHLQERRDPSPSHHILIVHFWFEIAPGTN